MSPEAVLKLAAAIGVTVVQSTGIGGLAVPIATAIIELIKPHLPSGVQFTDEQVLAACAKAEAFETSRLPLPEEVDDANS